MARRALVLGVLALACIDAVKADNQARHLLGGNLGYVPQGCSNLIVSVAAQESDPSWFQDAPEIRGQVTLSNPNTFNIPVDNIIIQARSSGGLRYSTTADCGGGSSTVVPYNPQPYAYGTVTCSYRIVLDRNVFGSYGSDNDSNRRRLQSGYGYFPSPDQRDTWTVVAVATLSYSNAQCLSAPTPVNTDCWWTWLEGWYKRHHHHHLFGGRKLMRLPLGAHGDKHTKLDANRAVPRQLAVQSSGLNNCNGLIYPTAFLQANVDGSRAVVGKVTLLNPGPVSLPLSSIKVTVANTIGFRPLFVNADCHGATAVVAFGSITCSYIVDLPTAGQSADPSVWTSVAATAFVGSNVDCTSAAVPVVNTLQG